MQDAITPEVAKEAGLVSQTQGFSMRRWDFASACLNQLDNLKRTAPQREPRLVKVSAQLAEIWAKPLTKVNHDSSTAAY